MDGVWLDMNEVSNFCNGECWHYPALNNTNLPFVPGETDLNNKCMDILARHFSKVIGQEDIYIEYNVHSTYGFLESKATS
jgi:alpha-glucosidase (family GH31 glycosyl hydrolase)